MKKLFQIMLECQTVNLFKMKKEVRRMLTELRDSDPDYKVLDYIVSGTLDYQRKIVLFADQVSNSKDSFEGYPSLTCQLLDQQGDCPNDCPNCSCYLASLDINAEKLCGFDRDLQDLKTRVQMDTDGFLFTDEFIEKTRQLHADKKEPVFHEF